MIFHGALLLLLGIAIASCSGTFLKSLFHPETVKISKIQNHGPVQKIYLPFGVHRARKPTFLPYPMPFALTKDCDHHKKPLSYTIPEVKPVKVQEKKPCKNETILHRVPEAPMLPAIPVITPQVFFHEPSIPIVENPIPSILHQLIPCDRHENMPQPPKIQEHISEVLPPFIPQLVHISKTVHIPEAPILPTLVMPEIPTNLIVEEPKVPCEHTDVIPALPIHDEPGSPEPVFIPEVPVLPPFILHKPMPILESVQIPEAPILPTLVMPEIPTNLIVEEPKVQCEHTDVIPALPIFEKPGSAEPIFIPEAPVLPPFITHEPVHVPEPVRIPEAPILPTLAMPEIPTNLIIEEPKLPCKHKDVIPALPIYEKPGSAEPIFIPEAPVLPSFIPPESVHIPKPFLIPEAPIQPTLVMSEIPTNLIVEEPKLPCKHKDVIPALPIYEKPGSPEPVFIPEAPVLPPFIPNESVNISEPVHISEAPLLPSLVMPESPKIPCEHKDVIPALPMYEEPTSLEPVFIPEAPVLPPFIPPEPILIPEPVHISEAPLLPAILMPEIPKVPCDQNDVIPALPNYEEPTFVAPEPVHIPESVNIPEAPILPALVMPEIPTNVEEQKVPCEQKYVIPDLPKYEEPAVALPEPFFIPEASVPELVHIPEQVYIPEAPVLPALVMPEIPVELSTNFISAGAVPCDNNNIAPSHSFITQERFSEELDTFDNFLPPSWSSSPIVVQAPMQIVFDGTYESGRPNIVQDCVDTIIKGRVLPNIVY